MENIKTKITYLHNQGSDGDYVSQYNYQISPKSQYAFMRDRFNNHSVTKEWCDLMLEKNNLSK